MLFFALLKLAPLVIVLISGNSDFNSVLSKLRNRQCTIVLIQANKVTKPVVKTFADKLLHWKLDVLTPKAQDKDFEGDKETPTRIAAAMKKVVVLGGNKGTIFGIANVHTEGT
ncbi:hypothetical protein HK100_006792, partial [Physocladia obscura]